MSGFRHPAEYADSLCRQVIGAAIEVHRSLGPGYLESIYEEAVCVELISRGIPYLRQAPLEVIYKGSRIGSARLDLLVGDCLLVELKSVLEVLPIHQAVVISYLKMARLDLGLIVNFHATRLVDGIRRVVYTQGSP